MPWHMFLGLVDILTRRAAEGIANVNMRWRWIEISRWPMPLSGMVRFLSVAPKKQRLTLAKPCTSARAIRRLHLDDFRGHGQEPPPQLRAGGRMVSPRDRGEPELSASKFRVGRRPRAARSPRRGAFRRQRGLALDPAFTIARYSAAAITDIPTYLAGKERLIDGLRKAGVPEQ